MSARYPDGVPPQRPRGRPRVEEPRTSVSTWLPASTHEKLIEVAKQQTDGNVSDYVRKLLILRLK